MTRVNVDPAVAADAFARAGYRCERCHATAAETNGGCLELHHFLGRRPTALVNDPDNLVVLCKRWAPEEGCHDILHRSKTRAIAWFIETFGEERFDRIRAIQNGRTERVA